MTPSPTGSAGAPAAGTETRPGLYVHVPFCSAICPYCDFAVVVGSAAKRRSFVGGLEAELALVAATAPFETAFDTIYLGGGTPSLLGAEALHEVLEALRRRLDVDPDAHIYLEANPEDVDDNALAAWCGLGVTFLSLGVQRLDDAGLRFLGRRHDGHEAVVAIERALDSGIETVSVDLIYGLPDETPEAWRKTLDQAVARAPQHLSCYQLTIEPKTPFGKRAARGEDLVASDDAQARRFRATHELLGGVGYEGYEVSNFARAGHRSGHNQKYWHHVPYLGIGPSAHSFDGRARWWNERHVARWSRRLGEGERPIAEREVLRPDQLAFETVMLGLRTLDGLDRVDFRRRFGFDPAAADPGLLDRHVARGLLIVDDRWIRPTLDGLAVAEALAVSWPLPA